MGTFTTTHQLGYQNGNFLVPVQVNTRVLTDGDADTAFELGDNVEYFGTYSFIGTMFVDGQEWPYFQLDTDTQFTFIALDQAPVVIPLTASPNGLSFDGACFAPGTLIAAEDGEKLVETLRIGDKIMTGNGASTTVLWVGVARKPTAIAGEKWAAVRVEKGALGDGLPHSDLTITADHGIVMDGYVINSSALVNGTTIRFVPLSELPNCVTYYHIETENYDVIFANGAPAETFVDFQDRRAFDNFDEYLDLYGTDRIIPEMDRPRISAQRMLPVAIKARLGLVEQPLTDETAAA
jgi:hypothetical protein